MSKNKISTYKILFFGIVAVVSIVFLSALFAINHYIRSTYAVTPYLQVNGNHFVDGNNNPIILRGAARWSMEFSCGDGHFTPQDFQAMKSWGMNIVRIPLNENYLLYPALCNNQYLSNMQNAVSNAEAAGLYVLLDLHWIAPYDNTSRGGQFPLTESKSVTVWQQIATMYKNDPHVLFEPLNEPHQVNCATWQNGGLVTSTSGTGWINQTAGSYTGIGMQTIINTIRSIAPNNMIIVDTSGEADASCAVSNGLSDTNLAYQSHFYHTDPNSWQSSFQSLLVRVPVIAGEFDSAQGSKVVQVFEGLQTGYLGWAWVTGGMINNWSGTPADSTWQSIHDVMHNASQKSPSAPPSTTPTRSLSQGPTPTSGSGGSNFSLIVCPHGLGNCGDNVNPNSSGNTSPKHISTNVLLNVLNNNGQSIITGHGTISYSQSLQHFQGTVSTSTLASGQYLVSVKMDGFLSKQISGIVTVTNGQITILPSVSLVTGDINNDNQLDILDYNILVGCFGSKQSVSSCIMPPTTTFSGADINDDGAVDGIDYNLFLRELSIQKGIGGNPTAIPPTSPTLPPGVAQTPPIGWNHYNHFGNNANETLIKSIADAIATNGMKNAGYQYINIDDSWQGGRDPQGNITANSNYPSGIKALADYIHGKGLKFGLYTTPANTSCGGKTGSAGHFDQDVATFASWGVDYIKLDWCGSDYSSSGANNIVQQWYNAINQHGRPMFLSINAGGNSSVGGWAKNYPPIMWRSGDDICASWFNKTQAHNPAARDCFNVQYHNGMYDYLYSNIQDNIPNAGPNHFADPDMLEVGNPGLSLDEEKTHFSMWAMWSAPLIAGNDPRSMNGTDDASLVLLNREVIVIDQDPAVKIAKKVQDNTGLQVWSKSLQATGTYAVALVNTKNTQAPISFTWNSIGLSTVRSLHDLWLHQDILIPNTNSYSTSVPPHGVVMLQLTGN